MAEGDPLFHVYPRSTALLEEELQRRVAFGSVHTMEQHPNFGLRIIVDIAIRALSPAINDPTTAVQALDRIQILLRRIGERDLGDGWISDCEGRPRLKVPAPGWEDFLWLGISEIRSYGASSLPVMRRLRGMLENLIEELPPHRIPSFLSTWSSWAALRSALSLTQRIFCRQASGITRDSAGTTSPCPLAGCVSRNCVTCAAGWGTLRTDD